MADVLYPVALGRVALAIIGTYETLGASGRHRCAWTRALGAKSRRPVPAPQADEPTRIQVEVTRVPMLFTVTDKKGRFVTDLVKDDFEIFENKKPQEIAEFSAESDLPLRIAILIDTSNSIRDRFRFEQEAASEFVKSVIKSKQDKGMVVSFDTEPELAADLIEDTGVLEKAIRGLRPGGGTVALRRHLLRVPGQAPARPALHQVPPRDHHAERWRR